VPWDHGSFLGGSRRLKKATSTEFSTDYEHYLAHQVLPPIERLCDPIEGTDRARLAECLGLDPNRYKVSAGSEAGTALATLDSQVSDAERFRDSEPFLVRCRGCKGQMAFSPIWERESSILQSSGPICPACNHPFGQVSLQTQLEIQIRACIGKYYEGWTVCNDAACGNRWRSMGVYGRRCSRLDCSGTARFEYSDVELYNQLRFFDMLFDKDKAEKAATGTAHFEEVRVLGKTNLGFLGEMRGTVNKYIDKCGRRWVDLGALFSTMKM